MSKAVDLDFFSKYSFFQGAPESTYGKTTFDRQIEKYGDINSDVNQQINYLYLNGTDIGAAVRASTAGTVGATIKVHLRADEPELNTAFEDLYSEASESMNFDITGRWHGDGGWRAAMTFIGLQGGLIQRYHYNVLWKIPYRLEILGIDKIDASINITEEKVVNGIKTDKYGRIKGLYLFNDDAYANRTSTFHSMDNMDYYLDTWTSLSQYTAVSRFVTILQNIDGMSQYTMAEIKAATDRSKNGVFWHTELYASIQTALNDLIKSEKSTEEAIDKATNLIKKMANEKGIGVRGVTPTPVEDSITVTENKSASIHKEFSASTEKKNAASLGGSQASVYRDIDKGNMAAIKITTAYDEREFKIKFDDFINRIMKPYLKRLLKIGVQTERLPLSHEEYFANPRKYEKFDCLRTANTIMSEKDDAIATAKYIDSGVSNIPDEYTKKTGRDYDEDELKREQKAIALEEKKQEMWEKSSATRPLNKDQIQQQKEEKK